MGHAAITKIIGSVFAYPVPHNYFYHLPVSSTYCSNIMVFSTQTLAQIKSQEFIGYIKPHFMTTSPVTYVTNGIQDFVKCWVNFDLRPDNMLFGRLQPLKTPVGRCKITTPFSVTLTTNY